jgi:uncharacterized membrane protein
MELFDNFFDFGGGLHFLTRYAHVLFGITWIGLLYFFNFVQVPSFAEMEAAARSEALRKITKRALWWFRWAAMLTLLSGLLMWAIAGSDYKPSTSLGLSITLGSILGITMAANVWMVIWPNQRINIGSAEAVAAGGEADPAAPGAAKAAGRASRVNAFFSIPMAFFMVFTSHFAPNFGNSDGKAGGGAVVVWIIFLVVFLVAELSALGKLPGGLDSPFCVQVLDDHKKVIIAGLVVTAVLYFIGWELAIGS